MLRVQPIERPDTLKNLAYGKLKGLLLSGGLARDRIYSASEFAEKLGISRTPVREALLELAAESYFVFVEGRGVRVKEFTAKEIRDFFETRRLVEPYVLEQVAPTLDVKPLDDNHARLKRLASAGDLADFLEADKDFHAGIVRSYGNAFLEPVMERLANYIALFGLQALSHEGRVEEVIREHGAILQAVRRKDGAGAAGAMRQHLVTTEKYVLGKGTL